MQGAVHAGGCFFQRTVVSLEVCIPATSCGLTVASMVVWSAVSSRNGRMTADDEEKVVMGVVYGRGSEMKVLRRLAASPSS